MMLAGSVAGWGCSEKCSTLRAVEDALVQFNKQVERFARCSRELEDVLAGKLEKRWAAGKIGVLHLDLAVGCWQFADAYGAIVYAPDEEPESSRSIYGRSEFQRLVVVAKALTFFVRGYQDGLAGAAKLASGGVWGRYPSSESYGPSACEFRP
jgi:hypothetical protein